MDCVICCTRQLRLGRFLNFLLDGAALIVELRQVCSHCCGLIRIERGQQPHTQ